MWLVATLLDNTVLVHRAVTFGICVLFALSILDCFLLPDMVGPEMNEVIKKGIV